MITKEEYSILVAKNKPNSKSLKNLPKAFLFGGLICVIGELIFIFLSGYFNEEASRSITSITLIFLASLLTGLGVFDKIAKHAGAGTIVPITGFSNAVTSAAMEFKTEGLILGTMVKMFIIAGPVIVTSTVGSMLIGLVYWIITLFK